MKGKQLLWNRGLVTAMHKDPVVDSLLLCNEVIHFTNYNYFYIYFVFGLCLAMVILVNVIKYAYCHCILATSI